MRSRCPRISNLYHTRRNLFFFNLLIITYPIIRSITLTSTIIRFIYFMFVITCSRQLKLFPFFNWTDFFQSTKSRELKIFQCSPAESLTATKYKWLTMDVYFLACYVSSHLWARCATQVSDQVLCHSCATAIISWSSQRLLNIWKSQVRWSVCASIFVSQVNLSSMAYLKKITIQVLFNFSI